MTLLVKFAASLFTVLVNFKQRFDGGVYIREEINQLKESRHFQGRFNLLQHSCNDDVPIQGSYFINQIKNDTQPITGYLINQRRIKHDLAKTFVEFIGQQFFQLARNSLIQAAFWTNDHNRATNFSLYRHRYFS